MKCKILIIAVIPSFLLLFSSCLSNNIYTRAVEENDMSVIVELLKEQDIDKPVFRGMTLLMVAAEKGNYTLMRYLVERGADVNAEKNPGGLTALRYAIAQDNLITVQYLLDNGADVLQKNEAHWTALMTAAKYGNIKIAQALVAAGADVHAETLKGTTAISLASDYKHYALFLYFSKFFEEAGETESEADSAVESEADSAVESEPAGSGQVKHAEPSDSSTKADSSTKE